MPRAYLAALIVTNYVIGHISPPAYGQLRHTGKPLPTGGQDAVIAERALAVEAGLCGQASSLAMVLYGRLRVKARQLDILYPEGGHTTVEVRYDGGWHWFDPILGYHYVEADNVLSLIDALQHPDPGPLRAGSVSLWAQLVRRMGLIMPADLDPVSLPTWRVTPHNSTKVLASCE